MLSENMKFPGKIGIKQSKFSYSFNDVGVA